MLEDCFESIAVTHIEKFFELIELGLYANFKSLFDREPQILLKICNGVLKRVSRDLHCNLRGR